MLLIKQKVYDNNEDYTITVNSIVRLSYEHWTDFDQKSPLHRSEKYKNACTCMLHLQSTFVLFTIFANQETGTIHVSTTLCIYEIACAM